MPSIILTNERKKKFEKIRGKFLATGKFLTLSRADTLSLMCDVLLFIDNKMTEFVDPFAPRFIDLLNEQKEEDSL